MKAVFALLLSILVFNVALADDFVLEEARRRARAASGLADDADLPYTPVQLSFTPGLAYPFGLYDASVAVGLIGAMNGSVSGLQASNVFNLSFGPVAGLQAAGVFNIADGPGSFVQAAGVFNIAGDVSGFQTAGVFNIVRSVSGFQSAGVFNIAESASGFMAAGVFNIAESMDGVAAAGLFNAAGNARGVMIGLVNVAERLDGVAIGLVNVIGNGVHDFSVDYQWESEQVYLGYRTGTTALYASFYAGLPSADLGEASGRLSFGAGIGHRQVFFPFALDVEVGAESVFDPAAADWGGILSGRIPASSPVFGSLRATFGLGGSGGFGAYLGVKADFEGRGAGRVPEHLRFGEARAFDAFGLALDFWPKIFAGIRF